MSHHYSTCSLSSIVGDETRTAAGGAAGGGAAGGGAAGGGLASREAIPPPPSTSPSPPPKEDLLQHLRSMDKFVVSKVDILPYFAFPAKLVKQLVSAHLHHAPVQNWLECVDRKKRGQVSDVEVAVAWEDLYKWCADLAVRLGLD